MFHGRIAYISPAVDQSTRTFTTEILVDNPQHRLKPGFFAKGDILVKRDENVMAVPEDAISNLAGVSSVFVIKNAVVTQTTIQTGEHEGNSVEVVSGLQGNETLAASNLNELVSGTRVITGDDEGAPAADTPAAGQRRGGRGRGQKSQDGARGNGQ
jgi:RND family efflux transporter MFP subunit